MGGWGGGVTLIFSYISRLWLFFIFFFGGGGGQNSHHKIGLYLEVISMYFRVFSEGQGTEWRIFFGLLTLQISIWGA